MHLLINQLVHLPAKTILETAILFVILSLKTLAELLMLTYDSIHLSLCPFDLFLHARDLTFDGAKFSLCLIKFSFQIGNLAFKCCDLIL